MTDVPIAVQVVELPVDRLRRLSLTPDVPRPDLWEAIAAAQRVMAELEQRVHAPITLPGRSDTSGSPVQPG